MNITVAAFTVSEKSSNMGIVQQVHVTFALLGNTFI